MMKINRRAAHKCFLALLVTVGVVASPSAIADGNAIVAQQTPGQFEVLEGSPLQLRVSKPDSKVPVKSYSWRIVEGVGGTLVDPETAEAVFYAKSISDEREMFRLELTTTYEDEEQTKAGIFVQVHKRPDKGVKKTKHRSAGPWIGFGLGFGFGYLWNYPVYVPIIVPVPPEEVWPPGEQLPAEAYPLDEGDIEGLPDDLQPEELYGLDEFDSMESDLMGSAELEADLAGDWVDDSGLSDAGTADVYAEPMIEAEPMPEPMPMDDYGGMDDFDMMDY